MKYSEYVKYMGDVAEEAALKRGFSELDASLTRLTIMKQLRDFFKEIDLDTNVDFKEPE